MQKTHFLKMGQAEPPRFFKIVLEQTLRNKKLQVPKEFVKKYGDQIPGKILLEDPIGVSWKVEVSRCKGEVYLHNGWEVFAEHYSLRYGHLLVFGYEGNDRFRVIIFDKSATEIKYPYSSIRVEGSSSNREDDASTETLDCNSRSRKRRDKSPLPSPQTQKMMRTQSTNKAKRVEDSAITDQDLSTKRAANRVIKLKNSRDERNSFFLANEAAGLKTSRNDGGCLSAANRCRAENVPTRMEPPLYHHGESEALRRARNFSSKNPFFIINLHPSHINPGYEVGIPYEFAKRYFIRKRGEVILFASEKTWTVRYNFSLGSGQRRARFTGNWKAFARDTNLQVSDVCTFELLKGKQIALKVTIFRVMEEACKYSSPAKCDGLNQVSYKTRSAIKTESDPSCNEEAEDEASIEILGSSSPSTKGGEISPSPCPWTCEITRTHSPNKTVRNSIFVPVLLDSGQKKSSHTEARVHPCDTGNVTYQVKHKTRSVTEVDSHTGCNKRDASNGERHHRSKVSGGMRPFSTYEKAKALRRVGIIETKNSFVVTMQRIYINPGYCLRIPAWFCRRYLVKEKAEIILCASNEKTWSVNYKRQNRGGAWIGSGWKEFVEDNNLRIGDICVFQLIKATEMIFKVTIYRGGKGQNCFESLGNELTCKKSIVLGGDQSPSCLSKQGALEGVRNFASEHPSFEVVLQKRNLDHGLNIPRWFVRKMAQRDEYLTLQAVNGSWPVKLVRNLLSAGWSSFAKGNFLQVGDVCVFELIKIGDVVLKVSVFRSST